MTSKGDRIGRLTALLEKIRARSTASREAVADGVGVAVAEGASVAVADGVGLTVAEGVSVVDGDGVSVAVAERVGLAVAEGANGVAAGEAVAHWAAAEDTEVNTTYAEREPALAARPSLEERLNAVLAAELAAELERPYEDPEEQDSFRASMLDEYEISDDVVEINVDTDDDSVRTSVHTPMLDTPSLEIPEPSSTVAMAVSEAQRSGARLAGASGVVLSDADEIVVAEADLVPEEDRGEDVVTVEVEELEEPPTSSRRPIALSPAASPLPDGHTTELEELAALGEPMPPFTPPPVSGRQMAVADFVSDPEATGPRSAAKPFDDSVDSGDVDSADQEHGAAPTLQPVAPIEASFATAPEDDVDAPRQIWKATGSLAQAEPETFGALLDATLSL